MNTIRYELTLNNVYKPKLHKKLDILLMSHYYEHSSLHNEEVRGPLCRVDLFSQLDWHVGLPGRRIA